MIFRETRRKKELVEQLKEWRRNRLQNYASKKGLKYQEAIKHLESHPSSMIEELGLVCDHIYHSSQEPNHKI